MAPPTAPRADELLRHPADGSVESRTWSRSPTVRSKGNGRTPGKPSPCSEFKYREGCCTSRATDGAGVHLNFVHSFILCLLILLSTLYSGGVKDRSISAEYPFIPSLSFPNQNINFDLTHKRGRWRIPRANKSWILVLRIDGNAKHVARMNENRSFRRKISDL